MKCLTAITNFRQMFQLLHNQFQLGLVWLVPYPTFSGLEAFITVKWDIGKSSLISAMVFWAAQEKYPCLAHRCVRKCSRGPSLLAVSPLARLCWDQWSIRRHGGPRASHRLAESRGCTPITSLLKHPLTAGSLWVPGQKMGVSSRPQVC